MWTLPGTQRDFNQDLQKVRKTFCVFVCLFVWLVFFFVLWWGHVLGAVWLVILFWFFKSAMYYNIEDIVPCFLVKLDVL